MRRELGLAEAASEAGRDDSELFPEAAELLGELGFGVGVRDGGGEAAVEEAEVFGEGEATMGGAVEEALEEEKLVGLGPDSVVLKRGRSGGAEGLGI